MQEAPPSTLISPCLCTGTQHYLHSSCLQAWRHTQRKQGLDHRFCRTCLSPYTVQYQTSPSPKVGWIGVLPWAFLALVIGIYMPRISVVCTEAGLRLALIQYGAPVPGLKAPFLLVAESTIAGGMFRQSQVIILEYSYEWGSKGLIINSKARKGGPVSPSSIHLLHTCAQAGGTEVLAGLFYQGNLTEVEMGNCDYTLLKGFSGWAAGQLDGEIRAGHWTVKEIKEAKTAIDAGKGE